MKRLRKEAGEQGGAAPDVVSGTEDKPLRAILCSACEHPITDEEARIEVAARHRHTCINPAGFVYRIACFRSAPGCEGQGEWSDHYSWFAGYAWRISVCARCSVHLGWAYRGEGSPFFGLIEDRLVTRE